MTGQQIVELMTRLSRRAAILPPYGAARAMLLDAAVVIGHQRDLLIETDMRIAALETAIEEILTTKQRTAK